MNVRKLGAHERRIESLLAGRDAVLAASQDGTFAVWPLDGHPPRVLAHFPDDEATCLARDGADLLLGTNAAVHRLTGGRRRVIFEQDDCTPVAVDARAGRVAVALHDEANGSDHPIVMLAGDERVWEATAEHWPYAITIAPDGRSVIAACWDARLVRFDAGTGAEQADLAPHGLDGPIHDLAWVSPTRLAVVGLGGMFAIVDVPTNAVVFRHDAPAGLHAVAASPDGRWLAIGGNAGSLSLFDVARAAIVDTIELAVDGDGDDDDEGGGMFPSVAEFYDVGGPTAIHALAFEAGGTRVCAGLESGALVLVTAE